MEFPESNVTIRTAVVRFAASVALVISLIFGCIGLLVANFQEAAQRRHFLHAVQSVIEAPAIQLAPTALSDLAQLIKRILGEQAIVHVALLKDKTLNGADTTPTFGWQYDQKTDGHSLVINHMGDLQALKIQIYWNSPYSVSGRQSLAWQILGFAFAAGCLTFFAQILLSHRYITPLQTQLNNVAPLVDLARGTQMMAHDIRKPLTTVKIVMQSLQTQNTMGAIRQVLSRFAPEVQRVVETTDQMIVDIMELGTAKPQRAANFQALSVETLVESALTESLKLHRRLDVAIEYRWQHSRKIEGDQQKLLRVLTNIICNALQAMPESLPHMPRLWFQTRESGTAQAPYLELAVGNSDSLIPAAELSQLFQPFFTRRKKGGTGLGLAVVDKIIRDHGGRVWVQSDQEVGTEFWLSLRLSNQLNRSTATLPSRSKSFVERFEHWTGDLRSAPDCLNVVVLDDDLFILDAWKMLDERQVWTFSSPKKFLAALSTNQLWTTEADVIVIDHFFDNEPEWTSDKILDAVHGRVFAPIVVSSNLADALPRDARVTAYIDKLPLTNADLREILAKAGARSAIKAHRSKIS